MLQCWGKEYGQRICKFYNLLLWNDTFYYVTAGVSQSFTSGTSYKSGIGNCACRDYSIKEISYEFFLILVRNSIDLSAVELLSPSYLLSCFTSFSRGFRRYLLESSSLLRHDVQV